MKKIILLLMAAMLVNKAVWATKDTTQSPHLYLSKSYAGIWRSATNYGTYKIINYDGSFYSFNIVANKCLLNVVGRYQITSDSTVVEQVIACRILPKINNSTSTIKYNLSEANTLQIQISNPNFTNGKQPAVSTELYFRVN